MTAPDRPDWTQAPVAFVQSTIWQTISVGESAVNGTIVAAVAGRSIVIVGAQIVGSNVTPTQLRGIVTVKIGYDVLLDSELRAVLAISPNAPHDRSEYDANAAPLPVGTAALYQAQTEFGAGQTSIELAVTYYLTS